jgi:hypothetical protein
VDRRHFLISAGGSLILFGSPRFLWAKSTVTDLVDNDPHFFVQIHIPGAWDVTLATDPQVHRGTDQKDVFLEYRPSDILRKGTLSFGPAARSFATNHGASLAVVNGINMRADVGHSSAADYMGSGLGDGSLSWLVGSLKNRPESTPLGLLALGGQLSMNYAKEMPILDYDDAQRFFGTRNDNQHLIRVIQSAIRKNDQDDLVMAERLRILAQNKFDLRMKKDALAPPTFESEVPETRTLVKAFRSEIVNRAIYAISANGAGNLDTHDDHEKNHLRLLSETFQKIDEVFTTFKKTPFRTGSLFDFTTFMIFSEFSRTPFLNMDRGKDHNLETNSVIFAGKGVKPGLFGQSMVRSRTMTRDGQGRHFGLPIDFSTGSIVTSREKMNRYTSLVFPENIAMTVAEIFGDRNLAYGFGPNVRPIPGLAT